MILPHLITAIVAMGVPNGASQTTIRFTEVSDDVGLDGRIYFEHVFRKEGATVDSEQRTRRVAAPQISFAPMYFINGIQVVGPYLGDRTTLEFARYLESLLGGYRVPPIAQLD